METCEICGRPVVATATSGEVCWGWRYDCYEVAFAREKARADALALDVQREKARADALAAKLAEVSRPCGRCGGAGVYPYSQGEDGTVCNKLCECGGSGVVRLDAEAGKKPPAK